MYRRPARANFASAESAPMPSAASIAWTVDSCMPLGPFHLAAGVASADHAEGRLDELDAGSTVLGLTVALKARVIALIDV